MVALIVVILLLLLLCGGCLLAPALHILWTRKRFVLRWRATPLSALTQPATCGALFASLSLLSLSIADPGSPLF
jgi:hypothetical protein